jgi:hypothetical protein
MTVNAIIPHSTSVPGEKTRDWGARDGSGCDMESILLFDAVAEPPQIRARGESRTPGQPDDSSLPQRARGAG